MTNADMMKEFKTMNERLNDMERRLSQFSEMMHAKSTQDIEDANAAIAELADEVYKEE